MSIDDNHNIRTTLGIPPNGFDAAIVSVNSNGDMSDISIMVLEAFNYNQSDIKLNIEGRGFQLVQQKSLKPVLFVVTVGEGDPATTLINNLEKGLKKTISKLSGKSVWIPLMGKISGGSTFRDRVDGGLSYEDSYQMIFNILSKYSSDVEFIISLPENNKGEDLFDHLQDLSKDTNSQSEDANFSNIDEDFNESSRSESFFDESSVKKTTAAKKEAPVNGDSKAPPETQQGQDTDKIPFHLDNVEKIDRLNREPVAKSLARLINEDIFFKDSTKYSFMIHL
ncbi:MAG: hypothetical protein KJO77_01955, partial [Bacteroidia bacterium]|nr:hypothetical protein [Bacteroidia bacterium]